MHVLGARPMDKRWGRGVMGRRVASLASPKILMSIMAGRAYLSRKRGHLQPVRQPNAASTCTSLSLTLCLCLSLWQHSLATPAAPKAEAEAEAGHVLHLQHSASCLKLAPTFLRMKLSVWHSLSGCSIRLCPMPPCHHLRCSRQRSGFNSY